MHSSSDLGPPHAFLYWVLILCVRLLIWVLYLRLMVYYIRSLHLSSACGIFRPSCKIVCFLSKNNCNIHQRIAMVTMTFLMVTHQESWTNNALIKETASHVSIYIQTVHAICIKWSHYSCPIINNFILIEPLFRVHLSYKDIFSLSQWWSLNTGLNIQYTSTKYRCSIIIIMALY